MNKKLHVGNLPISITDQDLLQKFARFGEVDFAVVLKDSTSGESLGVGLVEMTHSGSASKAIEWLNFSSCEGQIVTVSLFDGQSLVH